VPRNICPVNTGLQQATRAGNPCRSTSVGAPGPRCAPFPLRQPHTAPRRSPHARWPARACAACQTGPLRGTQRLQYTHVHVRPSEAVSSGPCSNAPSSSPPPRERRPRLGAGASSSPFSSLSLRSERLRFRNRIGGVLLYAAQQAAGPVRRLLHGFLAAVPVARSSASCVGRQRADIPGLRNPMRKSRLQAVPR